MNTVEFPPPRERGIVVHTLLIIFLAGVTGVGIWQATARPIGLQFTLYIAAAVGSFLPIPALGYNLWSLLRAKYLLDRDSLVINWGLRVERIPVSDVEWVRSRKSLKHRLPLPAMPLPGAIIGTRSTALGTVEYLASDLGSILLVATRQRVFAISPTDPQAFLQSIQRAIEMGSLTPAEPQSIYPGFLISTAWRDLPARFFWLAGLFINLGLLIWVSLLIPSLGSITLGFLPSGAAGEAVPGVGLLLLPVISAMLFAAGWLGGLFAYRKAEQRFLALLLWANGLLISMLFLVAVMFIITTPV